MSEIQPYWQHKDKAVLYCADALSVLPQLEAGSVDFCLTDPPYGTTACAWDTVIPFAPMWAGVKHACKKRAAIALFGSQPFTSALVMSNPKWFRYEWIWRKNRGSNFLNLDTAPMREHENVCIFGEIETFAPQLEKRAESGLSRVQYAINPSNTNKREVLNGFQSTVISHAPALRHPGSVQKFNTETGFHPTQKPVALLRYLIRTYTQAGETVLDFTCGSGSTGVAAINEGRRFVGIELDEGYCEMAVYRIKQALLIPADKPKRNADHLPLPPLFENLAENASQA